MATEIDLARGYWKDLSLSYEEAPSRLPEALKKERFGIMTQSDIQETFKTKLGVDFRRYRIAASSASSPVGSLAKCSLSRAMSPPRRAASSPRQARRLLTRAPLRRGLRSR